MTRPRTHFISHMMAVPPLKTSSLEAVNSWEPGEAINEFYNIEDYVKRRAYFLSKHPDCASMLNGLFAHARCDAAGVFTYETEQVSVQEVRRREIRAEIEPLLPLPTDRNCASLDGHRSYPTSEWQSGVVYPAARATPQIDEDEKVGLVGSSGSALMVTSDILQSADQPQGVATQTRTPPGSSALSATKDWQLSQRDVPSTLSLDAAAKHEDVSANACSTTRPSKHPANSDAFTSGPQSQFTAPPSSMSHSSMLSDYTGAGVSSTAASALPPATVMQSHDLLARSSIDGLRMVASPEDHSGVMQEQLYEIDPRIASYAHRGTTSAVKFNPNSKQALAAKRATADAETVSSESAAAGEDGLSLPKKIKTLKPRKAQSDPVGEEQKAKPRPAKPAPPKDDRHHLAIVAGIALPKTQAEANRAATARYKLLHAQMSAARPSRSQKKAAKPDVLPEWFAPENFDNGDDSVRCVCGAVADDGTLMVACDKCNVWQHDSCAGPARRAQPAHGYLCHVCDPWAHRDVIARLRKANVLDEK